MRTLLLLIAFLLVPLNGRANPDMNSPLPWIVFTDSATALEAPSRDAKEAFLLNKDEQVSGTLSLDSETNDEWLAFTRDEKPCYVSRIHLTRPHPDNVGKHDLAYGTEIVNRWWGLPLDYEPSDLELVPEKYCGRGDTYKLRREARDALVTMFDAAAKDGAPMNVASAYRSGPTQVSIYTRNVRRNPTQRSSAPPGHSEHQLGTTVDLADADGLFVITGRFETTPQSAWLEKNAVQYGWVRSYYPDTFEKTGYISEPWHWRYVGRENAEKCVAERQRNALEKPAN